MSENSRKLFILARGLLLILVLLQPLHAQESREAAAPFDTYGDVHCEEAMAHLEVFAVALANAPLARGYLIVQGSRTLPGRALPHLSWSKEYLSSVRGIGAARLIVERGPDRDELQVQLWIIQPGAPPPKTVVFQMVEKQDKSKPLKFDEGWADVSIYQGKPGFWADYECPLRALSLKNFARAIRAAPDAKAFFIIYTAFGHGPRKANRVANFVRQEMLKEGIAPSSIKSIYGGHRDSPMMEMWIVPQDTTLPQPTPGRRAGR